jgi:hypothetical protein
MTLKWYYKNRTCDISMSGYVSNVLSKFQHEAPKHPQHTPSRYFTPVYRAKTQYATRDVTPPLTAKQCLTIQKVAGFVLYYARAVDPTVLMPLNDIATEQTKATEKNTGRHKSTVGLFSHSSGRRHQVSRLRHDISHQQRCILPLGFKRTNPARRSVLLGQQIPGTRHT